MTPNEIRCHFLKQKKLKSFQIINLLDFKIMACINPIKIPTNSRYIYKNYRQKMFNYVPCGKCYECRKQKTFDIMVRAYYDTSDFVVFDTLSYSNQNITWLRNDLKKIINKDIDIKVKNMRVLNYEDYQKFMKRLRKELNKRKSDVSIKYIVSAEYGHDDIYIDDNGKQRKGTNRPHYHIIFFVKGNIEPVELSHLIYKTWKNGRTDGVDCKGKHYFLENRLFKGYLSKYNVIGYLCKYVTKTNEYEKELTENINYVVRQLQCITYKAYDNEQIKKLTNVIKKKYMQFVKWSKGFGIEFINNENIENYEQKMYLQLRTDLKYKKYKLPLYYYRKIYMEYEKQKDIWQLNERGINMIEKKLKNEYENNKNKLILCGIKENVNDIAYYWTYVKDRKNGNITPDYTDEYYNAYNTINDKKNYEKGLIIVEKHYYNFETYVKKNVENIEEYDLIIEKVNKKINEENAKTSEIAKQNEEIKKNLKKIQKKLDTY